MPDELIAVPWAIMLVVALVLGLMVYRRGRDSRWSFIGAFLAALIPLAFTLVLGFIGLIIAALFWGAVRRATA
ncbi:MAG: hypothetical protein WD009_13085 [Phycisphaeraceae bacterium]